MTAKTWLSVGMEDDQVWDWEGQDGRGDDSVYGPEALASLHGLHLVSSQARQALQGPVQD